MWRRPAMLHIKVCWRSKGGHKPCLCEGVAGLRPATPLNKHGQYWLSRPCCFFFCSFFCVFFYSSHFGWFKRPNKIGRSRIGRSRNWPKSKLAEVEIGRNRIGRTRKKNWPMSKLAEVDHDRSQVSGFRFQVSGFRFQPSGFKISGFRFQVAGCRLQVAGCRFEVPGFKLQVKTTLIQNHPKPKPFSS